MLWVENSLWQALCPFTCKTWLRILCHVSVVEFFIESIEPQEFEGKKVLEVGSRYVNGSVRPFITRFAHPAQYVGVDIDSGRYVDIVLPAEKLVDHFGRESFDIVIASETIEHVKDWRTVIEHIKSVAKTGGTVYLTTRSLGFQYHAYPYDYWRYEINDMRKIFSDFNIENLTKDPSEPGVFIKAMKPDPWKPCDLSEIPIYSMILGDMTTDIPDINFSNWDPKTMLATLYASRNDLQEAFPEAANEDYSRLMTWVASLRLGSDPAANLLEPYKRYSQYIADIYCRHLEAMQRCLEQAKAMQNEKDQLLNSKSWKATAPMREVAREFKRITEYIARDH
jgi:SAM-dependent methyltransferase